MILRLRRITESRIFKKFNWTIVFICVFIILFENIIEFINNAEVFEYFIIFNKTKGSPAFFSITFYTCNNYMNLLRLKKN